MSCAHCVRTAPLFGGVSGVKYPARWAGCGIDLVDPFSNLAEALRQNGSAMKMLQAGNWRRWIPDVGQVSVSPSLPLSLPASPCLQSADTGVHAQLNVSDMDAYTGELPQYNDIFLFMFQEVFVNLLHINYIGEPGNWVIAGNRKDLPATPFDAAFGHGDQQVDVLSPSMLCYFDFLVANSPYWNGTNAVARDSVEPCLRQHKRIKSAKELDEKLQTLYAKRKPRGGSASKGFCTPLSLDNPGRRRRLMMEEEEEGAEESD